MDPFILSEKDLRQLCWDHLEALETWLRRLIQDRFMSIYGADILAAKDLESGELIVKREIRERVRRRMQQDPTRYSRPVDATDFGDIVTIICKLPVFKDCFLDPFKVCFPLGNEHAKFTLASLQDCRNLLAHHNPVSVRQAEQVVCYCGDIVDSLKAYYSMLTLDNEFNVPRIVSATDCFGNQYHPNNVGIAGSLFEVPRAMRVGDRVWFEIRVDPTFPSDSYTVRWEIAQTRVCGARCEIVLCDAHVAESAWLQCQVIAFRTYHRFGGSVVGYDDMFSFGFKILPPLDIS